MTMLTSIPDEILEAFEKSIYKAQAEARSLEYKRRIVDQKRRGTYAFVCEKEVEKTRVFRENLKTTMLDLIDKGFNTSVEIADELNRTGQRTYYNKVWTSTNVLNILKMLRRDFPNDRFLLKFRRHLDGKETITQIEEKTTRNLTLSNAPLLLASIVDLMKGL